MNSSFLIIAGLISFILAYRFYAKKLYKVFGIDNSKSTPAHTMADGVDYCSARMPVLLGHHFSSIAGAAPIIGPIVAVAYGWGPVFIWIILGSIFLGAVHDLSSIIVSIRHSGKSIGEVIEKYLGHSGKVLFLIFCVSALILVIAVFMAVVAKTFVVAPATATSSFLYILLAIVFSLCINKLGFSFKWTTIVFVPILFFCIWLGIQFPFTVPEGGFLVPGINISISPNNFWVCILLVYIFVASVTPVWILLQPRDFLSSFLLYALIASGVIGIIFVRPAIHTPVFTEFNVAKIGALFPMLFVTVACGAISGFHSIVASGTTAKQLNQENDAVPVGYGAMLIEGLLAIIALITAIRLSKPEYLQMLQTKGPIEVFAQGIGSCLSVFHIPFRLAHIFATLAVSAFALTTLDTGTRLCRFCLQELFTSKKKIAKGKKKKTIDRYSATLICVILGGALALSGEWKTIWPVFGSANQLLAAIALLTVSIWLYHTGKNIWYTVVPMILMFTISLSALIVSFFENYNDAVVIYKQMQIQKTEALEYALMTECVLVITISLLFVLGIGLLILAIKTIKKRKIG
ncbi:carbon starvation protein A [bacterium]|nr:carbon starvation protein A [bacterium]